jgi:hypothetical protein
MLLKKPDCIFKVGQPDQNYAYHNLFLVGHHANGVW